MSSGNRSKGVSFRVDSLLSYSTASAMSNLALLLREQVNRKAELIRP